MVACAFNPSTEEAQAGCHIVPREPGLQRNTTLKNHTCKLTYTHTHTHTDPLEDSGFYSEVNEQVLNEFPFTNLQRQSSLP